MESISGLARSKLESLGFGAGVITEGVFHPTPIVHDIAQALAQGSELLWQADPMVAWEIRKSLCMVPRQLLFACRQNNGIFDGWQQAPCQSWLAIRGRGLLTHYSPKVTHEPQYIGCRKIRFAGVRGSRGIRCILLQLAIKGNAAMRQGEQLF